MRDVVWIDNDNNKKVADSPFDVRHQVVAILLALFGPLDVDALAFRRTWPRGAITLPVAFACRTVEHNRGMVGRVGVYGVRIVWLFAKIEGGRVSPFGGVACRRFGALQRLERLGCVA